MTDDDDINKYSRDELLEVRNEIDKILTKSDNTIIQKPCKDDANIDDHIKKDMDSWEVLTKLYENNLLDSKKVLKDYLIKVANCPDITKLFQKLLDGWKVDGEGNVSEIEKIINSCKSEGGNIGGSKNGG